MIPAIEEILIQTRRTINLCSFTHAKTLFLAVVLDFVLLALVKIAVHSWNHPLHIAEIKSESQR
jgi:hypothetical protein